MTVDEGDSIRAGQTLGELDRAPYENALLQAQANVSTAQAQYDLMMAATARKRLPSRGGGETGAGRLRLCAKLLSAPARLRASSAISANDLENAAPRAIRRRQRSNRRRISCVSIAPVTARRRLPEPKASLEQAQAALAQAKLDLHDTVLTAPSDGTLMTRAVEPGTMLNAGGTVLTLSLTHPVWVRAYVDEKTSARRSRDKKCCSIPTAGRISPITAKSVLSRRALNSRRRPSRPRICAIWSTVCALW